MSSEMLGMKGKILDRKGKKLIIALTAAALVLAGSATVYAWFTDKRKLVTITEIDAPSVLVIGAGAKESSLNINIGSIDVEDAEGKKNFVFSVYSDESVENYRLQLAHTTNIDFTYTIYSAVEYMADPGNDRVLYSDGSGTAHYYVKDSSAISGKYLNLNGSIADKSLHEISYDKYANVQKNAEPLYWQTDNEIQPANNNGQGFLDYYILEVSWNDDVVNNKETDMVYLTAGIV